ncbi:uncharacterized protein BYT42DRAFT_487154 [Radiomyces spectabilis]|uniref:uncharacterized protein n=1 Tax=Radiomyces spectabilis TaxID=64574 RepID=UPI00221E7FF5|nr:uncharacterized protein BYT42DRAFT_487154 [Radiomyces spectabilis]KAI8393333.1 hypothetical protein BYT42DRAFT_487154 [Radiomyces spectabilis]
METSAKPTVQRNFIEIDLSDYERRQDEIVTELMRAATTQGFFYVVNHGISVETIRTMFQASHDFFALPDNVKSKYPIDVSRNAGWEKLAQIRPSTGVADLKESLQLGFHNVDELWPKHEDAPNFKETATDFMHQCNEVSAKLLTCLALGLGFEADFFTRCHDITKSDCLNTLRCLHYHDITGQSFPPEYWRAGAHTDFDTLTLLFQRPGEDGLEVCPGREASTEFAVGDVWSPVSPKEGEIVCNLGDMIMRWSDDVFKSNFHRVRAPKVGEYQGPRYSIAYFNQANKSAIIQGRTRYPDPITSQEFIRQAMHRNYTALQELQARQAEQDPIAAAIPGTA